MLVSPIIQYAIVDSAIDLRRLLKIAVSIADPAIAFGEFAKGDHFRSLRSPAPTRWPK